MRVLLNVLAREIVTAGTRVDMLRGVPVIYSCYIGYDVVGHHSGPVSRNSLRVLRGIDAADRPAAGDARLDRAASTTSSCSATTG